MPDRAVNPAHKGVRSAGALRLVQLLTGLLSVALLARILGPDAYGTFGLASSVIAFGQIFTAVWGGAYITAANADKGDYDALAWTCAGTSLLATLLILGLAEVLAGLKGFAGVGEILPALTLTLVLGAPVTVLGALAQRQGRFDLLAQSESFSSGAALIAGVAMAYSGYGVWSLVGMEVTRTLCRLVILAARLRELPGRRCTRGNFKAILRFDGTRLTGRLMQWADQSLPLIVIVRLFGEEALGFYVLGWTVFSRIKEVVVGPFAMFAMPAVAGAKRNTAKIEQLLETWQRLSVFLAYPVVLGFVVICPLLVSVWLGERWTGVTLVMQLLVLSGLRSASGAFNGAVLEGMGRPDLQRKIYAAGLLITIIVLPIGAIAGVAGVAAATLVRGWITWPIGAFMVQRLSGYAAIRQFTIALPALLLSTAMAVSVYGINQIWPIAAPEWLRLLLSVVFGAIVYFVGAVLWMQTSLKEIIALILGLKPARSILGAAE